MGPERATRVLNACGQCSWEVATGVRSAESRAPEESRGAGSGGGQDPGQVGDGSGEIELGGSLLTPDVPSLPQTQFALAGPGGAPRPGGGNDRVRKPHCAGVCRRPATGLPAGAD